MSSVYTNKLYAQRVDSTASSTTSEKSIKAPIAHIESEDDFTSRLLCLESEPTMLFDIETISEALKVFFTKYFKIMKNYFKKIVLGF